MLSARACQARSDQGNTRDRWSTRPESMKASGMTDPSEAASYDQNVPTGDNEMAELSRIVIMCMQVCQLDPERSHGLNAIAGEDLCESCKSCSQEVVEYPGSEQSSSVTRFQVASRDLLETGLLVEQLLDTIKQHNSDTRRMLRKGHRLQLLG